MVFSSKFKHCQHNTLHTPIFACRFVSNAGDGDHSIGCCHIHSKCS